MPAEGPVSLNRYTIYAIVPILDLYAVYQIKKTRWYLLISWVGGWGLSIIIQMLLPAPYGVFSAIAVEIIISVYLIRRWVKEWNLSFNESHDRVQS